MLPISNQPEIHPALSRCCRAADAHSPCERSSVDRSGGRHFVAWAHGSHSRTPSAAAGCRARSRPYELLARTHHLLSGAGWRPSEQERHATHRCGHTLVRNFHADPQYWRVLVSALPYKREIDADQLKRLATLAASTRVAEPHDREPQSVISGFARSSSGYRPCRPRRGRPRSPKRASTTTPCRRTWPACSRPMQRLDRFSNAVS